MIKLKDLTNKFKASNCFRRLLGYFLLLILMVLSVNMLFIYEIGSGRFHKQISDSITSQLSEEDKHQIDVSKVAIILKHLQYKMVLVMLMVIVVAIIMIFIFLRTLLKPLNEIVNITEKLADGHLDETVPVRSDDEIGKLGSLINSLSINLQEILLHVWQHTTDATKLLDQIRATIQTQDCSPISQQIETDCENIQQCMEDMQALVQSFELYDIRLNHEKVMAGEKTKLET